MDPESDENSIDLRLPGEIENNFNQRLNDMFTKHQGLIYSKKLLLLNKLYQGRNL